MKFLNSIKWRLQLWYGLILVAVLAGFGFTAYQLESNRQFRRVDEELQRRFSTIANIVRPPPLRGPNIMQPNRPPRGQRPDEGPESSDARAPREIHIPPQILSMFDASDRNNFYFIIEFPDGRQPLRSTNAPTEAMKIFPASEVIFSSGGQGEPPEMRPIPPAPPVAFTYGELREIVQTMPTRIMLHVGCSVAPELEELRLTALKLTAIGGAILLVGLAGGWWFVGRALRPVTEISSTATKISAGDLSQRINMAETESELGQLAAVLNSTFARLEAAFAQQKQFASDAAHELRTPVTVMLTQTQTALNRERSAEDYRQTVEACQRAAQRMRRLIESLLELTRFEAGQEVLKRLRFDLSKAISDSVEMVQTLADEKKVKVFAKLEALEITGDPERLAQVVTNLLTNAIQYNQPGGEVRVRLEAAGGLATLTVTDTGPGIAPEDLPRVFERFYRADQSRTGNGNSGLGLSICKAIVEAHGGTIEAASILKTGTTFVVRLPV